MSQIDLHIHSKFSDDGEFTPKEIIDQCKAQGLKMVSITDHNSVRGVRGAMEYAEGMQVISGVELDCTYGGRNFHLLGYGFDHKTPEYDEIEQDILSQEKKAAEEKIRLFRNATGIPVNVMAVLAASENGVVTGEMIGEAVLSQKDAGQYEILKPYLKGGAKSDMPHVRFYWDFFSEGKPAYVPIRYISLPKAIALIHRTGGIAVLAHPGQNLEEGEELLWGIIQEGIDGIEVFSSYHKEKTAGYYLETAQRNHLLVTCGSDFHGKHKPQIHLGGHGAFIEDEVLIAGLENRLFGKA